MRYVTPVLMVQPAGIPLQCILREWPRIGDAGRIIIDVDRYTFPQANRFGVGGHLYFAPDVLSFSDAEQFREVEIHASYNVIQDADVYIAYRNIQGEYDDGSEVTFDTGINIGIRVRF